MELKTSKQFLKDRDRIKKNSKKSTWDRIVKRIKEAVSFISQNKPLPQDFNDHEINSHKRYGNCRDCHILGDLVLLYRIENNEVEILSILRLGTHSQLDL